MYSEDAMIADGLAEAYNKGFEDGKKTVEPKRGWWIPLGNRGIGVKCSECHKIQYGIDTERFYCQNCGAKMEG